MTLSVEPYSVVVLDDGRVTSIVESPHDDWDYYLNAGVYVLELAVFDAVRAAEPSAGEHHLVDGLLRSSIPVR